MRGGWGVWECMIFCMFMVEVCRQFITKIKPANTFTDILDQINQSNGVGFSHACSMINPMPLDLSNMFGHACLLLCLHS